MVFPDFFKLCNDWSDFFFNEEIENVLENIFSKISSNKYYPDEEDIFRCFYLTPLKKVRVVILGQDPYHNGSATGLCFDVKRGNPLNPSIQNIYNELEKEGFYPTKDGNLEHWSKQGVLLLNSALTVLPGQPESHLHHWAVFFEKVLKRLSQEKNIIWIILGKKASDYKSFISPKHKIFEATHPSPFSAHNPSKTQKAFMGSGIFKDVNNELYKNDFDKISW